MQTFPTHIFLTGVPGSRWSGIAQILETTGLFNTSDRTSKRKYAHDEFSGHEGAYFGDEMEFQSWPDLEYINGAWSNGTGIKLVKSHDWAYRLTDIKAQHPHCWIMMLYRPNEESFAWWNQAGGFNIKYPNYTAYRNNTKMFTEIIKQNAAILKFGFEQQCTWEYFTNDWVKRNFTDVAFFDSNKYNDILITLVK